MMNRHKIPCPILRKSGSAGQYPYTFYNPHFSSSFYEKAKSLRKIFNIIDTETEETPTFNQRSSSIVSRTSTLPINSMHFNDQNSNILQSKKNFGTFNYLRSNRNSISSFTQCSTPYLKKRSKESLYPQKNSCRHQQGEINASIKSKKITIKKKKHLEEIKIRLTKNQSTNCEPLTGWEINGYP